MISRHSDDGLFSALTWRNGRGDATTLRKAESLSIGKFIQLRHNATVRPRDAGQSGQFFFRDSWRAGHPLRALLKWSRFTNKQLTEMRFSPSQG